MLNIKEERNKLKMTQQEFADLLGVTRKTIVNYESGSNIPDTKEKIFIRILSNYTHIQLNEPLADYPEGIYLEKDGTKVSPKDITIHLSIYHEDLMKYNYYKAWFVKESARHAKTLVKRVIKES